MGRSDKKFCSDYCRNTYYNQANSVANNHVRQVNRILSKNRRILEELNPSGKVNIHKDKLLNKGFNFNYFTGIYKTQKGVVYYFCYEYGYLPLENNFYALVKRDEKL